MYGHDYCVGTHKGEQQMQVGVKHIDSLTHEEQAFFTLLLLCHLTRNGAGVPKVDKRTLLANIPDMKKAAAIPSLMAEGGWMRSLANW